MRNRLSDEQGFTLIELLVVILIIGILAAIALPNFIGQRGRAQDAGAKSNARNAVSQVEACFTDTQDYTKCTSPTNGLGNNTGLDFATITVTPDTANGYTISASSQTGNAFRILKDKSTGLITRTCAHPASAKDGACPTDGATW